MNRRIVAAGALVCFAAAGGWWMLRPQAGARDALEASGTVEATEADLGFQSGGRIAAVLPREGDAVAAGAVLARLDVAELEARRLAAAAQLEAARALLAELEAGARPEEVAQARAVVDAAAQQREDAERTRERLRALFEGGAVSRQNLDQAQTAAEVARARHEQAREQLRLVERGPRGERIAAQRAAVRQAEAQEAQIRAALESAEIRAPFAGVITVRHREPGEAVSPGAPVLSLMNPDDRWVRIYVREDDVGRVGIGQPARIRTDSHGERSFRGRVTYIASEAEFTPRNVQTAEERVKLVYAVKVALADDPSMSLKPGLPADIVLETERLAAAPR